VSHRTDEKAGFQPREKQKLIARVRRIRGQVDAIERSLTQQEHCADVLMLLANIRGGINSLMAEVLEDHVRLHMLSPDKGSRDSTELAEDLIDLVRAYLK
jgi:DNA-binding FrmR family transcriptional regulator